jgi:alanyl-tRNA synthetase
LTDELILEKIPKLIENAITIKDISLVLAEILGTREELIKLSKKITDENPSTIAILVNKNQKITIVGSSGNAILINLVPIIQEACAIAGGGAGGNKKERLVIGGGPNTSKFEEIIFKIKKLVIDALENL